MTRITLPNHLLLPEVENLLNEGERVTMRVKGNSMLPFIRGGRDSVVLQQAGTLRLRDIVLARLPGGNYVIHRVIALTGDEVLLMGDGNLLGTERCQRADIAGKVIRIVRDGKPIDCARGRERAKVTVWWLLLPVRRYLLAVYRRMGGVI